MLSVRRRQLFDELGRQAGPESRIAVKDVAHSLFRPNGPVQVRAIRVPIRLVGRFEPPEPFDAKADVLDLVSMNGPHDGGAFRVAGAHEGLLQFERVIEISSLEGQRQTGEIIQQPLSRDNRPRSGAANDQIPAPGLSGR